MGGFASFVCAFCGSSIIIGLVFMLCPEKYKQTVKFLFGLVLILSVISAFTKLEDITFEEFKQSETLDMQEQLDAASARLVYEETLRISGINFSKIEVCTDKTEDGSIIITKVIVYSDSQSEDIEKALGSVAQNYEVEIKDE